MRIVFDITTMVVRGAAFVTVITFAMLSLTYSPALGDTWLIKADGSGDAPHLAAGVDSSADGDSLVLAAGTFTGANNRDILITGKSITILGAGPSATVIDCDRVERAFWFQGSMDSRLQGVSVQWSWVGGSDTPIQIDTGACVTIEDCHFSNNRGPNSGVVECVDDSSCVSVSNCEFEQNWGGGVGAIRVYRASGEITDNVFDDNDGGTSNSVVDIWNPATLSTISGNTISNNMGRGIISSDEDSPTSVVIRNNTIVGNTTNSASQGAIWVKGDYNRIEYNIIAFNNSNAMGCAFAHASTIRCNLIFGNISDAVCPSSTGGNNLVLDPVFCGYTSGDFQLGESSPAAPLNNPCGVLWGAWPVACIVSAITNETPRAGYELFANSPNPFNPRTTIGYSAPRSGGVIEIDIFRADGSHVRSLLDARVAGGMGHVSWDGRDGVGSPVASGVYFYRMKGGGFLATRKMVLLK